MTKFNIELVGKVGSMALVNSLHDDIDYNIIAQISRYLKPGYIWVTSGAAEIGRLDYLKRTGVELKGDESDNKTDYSAQGQSILMQNYRQFMDSRYSLRQFLVEHHHFNDKEKCEYLKRSLLRCPEQGAIPIINYNDPVNDEEIRKLEIQTLKSTRKKVVECIDNDETASQIACLVKPKYLLILTSVNGIYTDINQKNTLVEEICGKNIDELISAIEYYQNFCDGKSRKGSNGARAKLEYIKEPIKLGTTAIIANSKFRIPDILAGIVPRTIIHIR
ncbi:MAG: uridylate kinase [Bacillota bacterium]|nr:uridylate kinase [Bacillota bacterium]